jgi:hypothetical protein
MGLRPSLPLAELARRDSALFVKIKRLFFTASKAKKQRRKEVTGATRR